MWNPCHSRWIPPIPYGICFGWYPSHFGDSIPPGIPYGMSWNPPGIHGIHMEYPHGIHMEYSISIPWIPGGFHLIPWNNSGFHLHFSLENIRTIETIV
jgi:hypothetical protein